jgi:hypothetical protein
MPRCAPRSITAHKHSSSARRYRRCLCLIYLAEVAERTLNTFCSAGHYVLAVFRPASCPRCEELDASYREIAARRKDATVVVISVRDSTEVRDPQPRPISDAVTTRGALHGSLHIGVLPAAILVDNQCHEIAAAVGVHGATAVVAQLGVDAKE